MCCKKPFNKLVTREWIENKWVIIVRSQPNIAEQYAFEVMMQ